MDTRSLIVICLVLTPIVRGAWRPSLEDRMDSREVRRGIHYHAKRHMLPQEPEKKRSTTPKPREGRKKPTGHLRPLEDDEMDNDEVVSVAIGPPSMKSKYEKVNKKPLSKKPYSPATTVSAMNLVKEVLTELGKEFLTKEVSEDFIFGQYVGMSMKNLTGELRLGLQHDILDLLVRYQKTNMGEKTEKNTMLLLKDVKIGKKLGGSNDTEEWPDFSNLEKIVG